MDDWEYDNWNNWSDDPPWKKEKEKNAPRYLNGHVMGKPEAKLMRKIQAETGMTQEEVRSHKKYRKMLADVQHEHELKIRKETNTFENVWPEQQFYRKYSHFFEEEEIKELWKRYAGGMIDERRPKNFHYATVPEKHNTPNVLQTILNSTDGQFYYCQRTGEIGFMYESNLTMFMLAYETFR